MRRLNNIFAGTEKALIVFECAGYPDMEKSQQRIEKIIAAGGDIIELGVPFSDPMADGSAVQEAYQEALRNNVSLCGIMQMLKNIRNNNPAIGLIISGYCNIFLQYGYEKLFNELAELEIDALRILDLPCEEYSEIAEYAEKYGVKTVISAGSKISEARAKKLLEQPGSIIYCESKESAGVFKKLSALPIALKLDNSFNAVHTAEAVVKIPCEKLSDTVRELKSKL